MKNKIINHRFAVAVLVFCIFYSTIIINHRGFMTGDHPMYIAPVLNNVDSSLFSDNTNINPGVYNPKYIAQWVESVIIQAGMSWAGVQVLFTLVSYLLLFLAFYIFCLRFEIRRIIFSSLLFPIIIQSNIFGELAFRGSFVGYHITGIAMSLCITAFALCIPYKRTTQRWEAALLLSALSSLIHIHWGLYSMAIIVLCYLATTISNGVQKFNVKLLVSLLFWIIAALIVVLPNALTDYSTMTNQEFIDVYVFFRTPHHLAVQSWGFHNIIRQCMILVLSIIVISVPFIVDNYDNINTCKEKTRILVLLKNDSGIIICLSVIILFGVFIVLQYIFTTIIPWSLIVKVFLPKYFKFARYILLFYFIKSIDSVSSKYRLISYWILPIVCLYWPTLALFIYSGIFLTEIGIKSNVKSLSILGVLIGVVLILLSIYFNNLYITVPNKKYYIMILFAFVTQCVFQHSHIWKTTKPIILPLAVVLLIIVLPIESIKNPESNLVNASKKYYELGKEFGSLTDISDGFVGSPKEMSTIWIQCISLRNSYVNIKEVPGTSVGIARWLERLENLENFDNMSVNQMAELLRKIDYEYVVVNNSNASQYDESSKFTRICGNNNYTFYKLVSNPT